MNSRIGFSVLRKEMSKIIRRWGDHRDVTKKEIDLHDVVMSGYACMFYQEPSLLQFQIDLESAVHQNNLRMQFDVENIPSTTQMKAVLDELHHSNFAFIFDMYHKKLDKINAVKEFKNKLGTYFNSVDGTQYFSSTKIHCKKCLSTTHKDGVHYSHEMLQSAIVLPGCRVVLPLMPVEISNNQGVEYSKQDSERKAFFRFLSNLKKNYLKLSYTFTLDALYADQVVIKAITNSDYHFIIVSKPGDNKYLYEEFSLVTTKTQAIEYDDGKHVHCYTWSNGLPFSSRRQVMVNLVKYEMKRMVRPDTFEIVYKNAWVTNHQITADNVAEIVLGGRARWKIENECFNTLKNQGYNLEHSYGHGENNLNFNFAILTTLAFFMHQILEFKDELFQALRKKCGSKMNLWNKLRTYIENLIFESFEVLMGYILDRRPYIGDRLLTPADYGTIIRAGPMIAG